MTPLINTDYPAIVLSQWTPSRESQNQKLLNRKISGVILSRSCDRTFWKLSIRPGRLVSSTIVAPVFACPRHLTLKRFLNVMLHEETMSRSKSARTSHLHLLQKGDTWHSWGDYRPLNFFTIRHLRNFTCNVRGSQFTNSSELLRNPEDRHHYSIRTSHLCPFGSETHKCYRDQWTYRK